MNKADGGPAFPNITPDMLVDGGPGMSLRDYFAGQFLSTVKIIGDDVLASDVASQCYTMADAMLAERAK